MFSSLQFLRKWREEMGSRILSVFIASFSLVLTINASADLVHVDIYSGFSDTGGGAPFSGLVGSFDSPDIQFGTAIGYNWHPFGQGSFGADINTNINVPSATTYTFTLGSDDGSLLFIDGNLVIDNGGPHGPNNVSGTATLSAGIHSLEVQFFEDFGGPSGVELNLPAAVTFAAPLPAPALGIVTLLTLTVGASLLRKNLRHASN